MPDIQFKRGEFQAFEVMIETGLHVGAIGDNLDYGEVVFYDGQTLKRGSMDDSGSNVPNLKGAIKAGWLVREGEEGEVYVPKPADIKIHSAESHGRDRGEGRRISTVQDEERDLGSREDIRRRAAQQKHKPAQDQAVANRQGTQVSEGAPTGAVATEDFDDEVEGLADGSVGRVVGKFATKAKADPVSIDKAGRVIKEIEAKKAPSVKKKAKASGDVQTARVGDDLEDLLPEAASSGKAEPGVAGEGKEPAEGSDEEAAAWARKRSAEEEEAAKARAEEARAARLAQAGVKSKAKAKKADVTVTPGATPVGTADEGEVVGKVRPADEAGTEGDIVAPVADEPEDDDIPPEAIIAAKIEVLQQFVPGFEWDFKMHWRKRVEKAASYKDNTPVLNAILSIETAAVKKHTLKKIYG